MRIKSVFIIQWFALCMLWSEEPDSTISFARIPKQIVDHQQPNYCYGPQHMYVEARYTTPRGIGYSPGYTTLQGFFAPRNFLRGPWLPFLDVRGHVDDNGKCSANAGLGFRYMTLSRLWGFNGYYDYHNLSHRHYNQIAAGFETLGIVWDFRINGYLPVGQKNPPFHNTASFQGNSLIVRYSQRFAMKGTNAEAGIHVDHFQKAPLYFAGGPYYLTAEGKSALGGELRARADLFYRYFRIEANISYDHLFRWIGQAQVSVQVPFGGRTKWCSPDCCKAATINERSVQQVDRFEIIPEVKRHTVAPAINPETGQPWVF